MKKLLAFLAGASVGFALLVTPVAAQTIPSGAWGSINYWGVGGLSQVLAPGLAGQCLTSQNVGSAPIWVNCQVSSLSLLPPINANSIMANNTLNFVAPQAIDVNRVLDMVGYDIIRPPLPESIIYKSNVGPNFNWQTLPPGTAGSLLTSGGPTNPIFWATSPAQGNLAAICATVGAVLYFDTPSLLWKCLNPGTSGQLLQTGGAAGNPSWLTVTLATLGGVPSTRNVNTSSPLSGGGALSADLTLTCPTCATTTNGGALSATAPETISAAGVIACATCATTTNGGALSATAPIAISAAGVISVTSPLPIANGGTNASTQANAAINVFPIPTRAGDVAYWNGSNWVTLAGNNSGTNVLSENASGVPSWSAVGSVTNVATGAGLSGGPITTTGTLIADPLYYRGYLSGLTLSAAGATGTFGIATGTATGSAATDMLLLPSAFTKTTAAWAVGTATGSLDAGSIANTTWYKVFEIKRPDTGVVDICTTVNALASGCTTGGTIPAAYTIQRYIGSMKTNGSAQWVKFIQDGDLFQWDVDVADISSTNPGTSAVTRTLASIPTGVRVEAILAVSVQSTVLADAPSAFLISDLSVSDQVPAINGANTLSNYWNVATTNFQSGNVFRVMTSTSQQVRSRLNVSGASTVLSMTTHGWFDRRGRD